MRGLVQSEDGVWNIPCASEADYPAYILTLVYSSEVGADYPAADKIRQMVRVEDASTQHGDGATLRGSL